MGTITTVTAYRGLTLFSYGFRPFFLFGAIQAGVMIPLWLAVFAGDVSPPTVFAPLDWHVHEMLFGYVAAVIAGFLLTAVPNWTGRPPIRGPRLAVLFSTWLAGRLTVSFSATIGWRAAVAVDGLFLLLLAFAATREIVAGRKWSNLMVVAIVIVLAAANIAFHVEAHLEGIAAYSARAGIAVVVTLISVIGGRIVPSFTGNWLASRGNGRMPATFSRFDAVAVMTGAAALAIWVVAPSGRIVASVLGWAGALHLIRLARWAGERTLSDRLVLILHLAYAFIPAGFFLAALTALGIVASGAGVHAWTGGAIGTMTVAVMTRASLGHTGQPLEASRTTQALYLAVVTAALARVCASLEPSHADVLLPLAGAAWTLAFLGFALTYARLLCLVRNG
ncbi:NnrS family protein [Bradyrhizobium sp. UFLA01-814]|uniref:NnrS family protein n=1 Tax=Bradyrhizobium sp. UFLA01-814 TaxID=3023480 RepID=UPI00398B2D55